MPPTAKVETPPDERRQWPWVANLGVHRICIRGFNPGYQRSVKTLRASLTRGKRFFRGWYTDTLQIVLEAFRHKKARREGGQ
jgi:hypothetical protein